MQAVALFILLIRAGVGWSALGDGFSASIPVALGSIAAIIGDVVLAMMVTVRLVRREPIILKTQWLAAAPIVVAIAVVPILNLA